MIAHRTQRARVIGNLVAALSVLAALASALFSLYPVNAVANCYNATPPLPALVGTGCGLGLIALASWVFLLRDRVVYEEQIQASAALGVVIVVLLALPAFLASGQYGDPPPIEPWPCSLGLPYELLAAMSTFTPLVAATVSYVLARWLPASRFALWWAAASGVTVWAGYLLFVYRV